jgi:chromosomal replication initiation ATPase DnaA
MKHKDKIETVLQFVSEYYDVPINFMKREFRKGKYVKARHIYCFICNHFLGATNEAIGFFINKNHATVNYAIKKIKYKITIFKDVENDVREIVKLLLLHYYHVK